MDLIEIKSEPIDEDDVTMAPSEVLQDTIKVENDDTEPVPIKIPRYDNTPPIKIPRLANGVVTNSDGTMANCEPTAVPQSEGGDVQTLKSNTGLTFNSTWTAQKALIDSVLPRSITCPVCEASFITGHAFWTHHLEMHWNQVNPTNFLCAVCCVAYKSEHACTSPTPSRPLHVCPECGFPTENLAGLESHIGSCASGMADQKLVCPRCPLAKPSISAFWEHFTEVHWNKNLGFLGFNVRRGTDEIRLVLCLPCGGVITGDGTQDAHIRSCHHESKKMICPDITCKAPAETPLIALEHFRDVHWLVEEGRQFICEACSFISTAPRKCCRTPRWLLLCTHCGQSFDDAGDGFQDHCMMCLGDLDMDGPVKGVRRCKIDNMDFINAEELTAHVVSAHPKPAMPAVCAFCSGEEFSDGAAVWEHCLSEHKDDALKKRYLCGTCGALHTSLAAYFDHQLYDHGTLIPPKFNCMTCGELSETRQELDKHLKTHVKSEVRINGVITKEEPDDDEREMKCTAEGCDLVFKGLKRLWDHYRHGHWSANKRLHFLCGECGEVYGTVNNIMTHNTEKHEGKATAHILCPTCGERFLDSDALEDHVRVCLGPRRVWPQCVVCKRYLPDKPCVTKHMVQFHPDEETACHVCDVVMKCSEIEEHQKAHPASENLFAEPQDEEEEAEGEGDDDEDEDEDEEEAMTEGDDDEDELGGDTSEEEILPVSRRRGRGAAMAAGSAEPAVPAVGGSGRGRGRGRGRGVAAAAARGGPVDCTFCAEVFSSWDELETHFNEEHTQAMTPVVRVRKMDGGDILPAPSQGKGPAWCDSVGASEMTSTTFDGDEEEDMEENDNTDEA